jgi:hypothetical protein
MKQISILILVIVFYSCDFKSKKVESLEKEIIDLKNEHEILDNKTDSLLLELSIAVEKNKFVPDLIIINQKFSQNPFEIKTPLKDNLLKSNYTSIDTTLLNNKLIHNQVDSLFTFRYDSSFIELFKNSMEEYIISGYSNSNNLNLKNNLRFGINKSDFFKLSRITDSIPNNKNNFRITDSENNRKIDLEFKNNKLKYIHFERYLE